MLILQARVAAGWIDASELPQPEPEPEYAEDEGGEYTEEDAYAEAEAVFAPRELSEDGGDEGDASAGDLGDEDDAQDGDR